MAKQPSAPASIKQSLRTQFQNILPLRGSFHILRGGGRGQSSNENGRGGLPLSIGYTTAHETGVHKPDRPLNMVIHEMWKSIVRRRERHELRYEELRPLSWGSFTENNSDQRISGTTTLSLSLNVTIGSLFKWLHNYRNIIRMLDNKGLGV